MHIKVQTFDLSFIDTKIDSFQNGLFSLSYNCSQVFHLQQNLGWFSAVAGAGSCRRFDGEAAFYPERGKTPAASGRDGK